VKVIVFVAGLSAMIMKPAAGNARRRYELSSAGDGEETTATTLFGWSTFALITALLGKENCWAGPLR
jgi:hypothetical protein